MRQTATQLVPQARTGKDVVVGNKSAHGLRCGGEVVRYILDRLFVTLGGPHDVVLQPECKGAAANVGCGINLRVGRGLTDHMALRVCCDQCAQIAGDAAALGLVVPVFSAVLHQVGHGVQAKTVQPPVQPKPQTVLVVGQDGRVLEIEVWHVFAKGAEVVALVGLGPRVFAPDVPTLGRFLLPHKPVVKRAGRAVFERADKHGVVAGTVVDDVVHHHANAACVRLA